MIPVSVQVLSATAFAAYPALEELLAYTRRIAEAMVPLRFWTLKRI